MNSSRFSHSPQKPKTARGYEKRKLKTEYGLRDVPAAGLTSNALDLTQLVTLFAKNDFSESQQIITNTSIEELLKAQGRNRPLLFGKKIGLGLFYYNDVFQRNISIVGHGGASVNHRSVIKFSPHDGYGVAVLSNSRNATGAINRIANKALTLLYEAQLGKPAPIRKARWPHKKAEDVIEAGELVGHYATIAGLARIYQRNDKLKVKLAGKRLSLYQKTPNGLYYLKYKLFGIFPIKLGALGNLGMALRKIDNQYFLIGQNTLGSTQLLGEKLNVTNISDSWKRRVGRYRVLTPIEVIELPRGGLKIVDGFLVAHAKSDRGDRLEFVLKPVNDNEAIIAGIGRSLGETVFVTKEGDTEVLRYSNIRFGKTR